MKLLTLVAALGIASVPAALAAQQTAAPNAAPAMPLGTRSRRT